MTDATQKKTYLVLVFTQDAANRYYTNWTGGHGSGGTLATVVPSITAKLAQNSGGIAEQELEIDLEKGSDSWLDGLTSGEQVAPVKLELFLGIVPFGPGETETEELASLGRYRLVRGIRNAGRAAGRLRLGFADHRSLLAVTMGIPCTTKCAWAFGDKTCGIDASASEETGTVDSLSRKVLTLSSSTDSSVVTSKPDASYWLRGFVSFEGLSIGIRRWDQNGGSPYEFGLVSDPPAAWEGQVVTLTPGCDKTHEICLSRWSNLEQFGGFGLAIPNHHPVTEAPSQ